MRTNSALGGFKGSERETQLVSKNTNYVTRLQSYSVVVKIDRYLLFKDRNLPFSETQRADLIHGMKI